MIKLYKASRDVQIQWMRENPGKTIALNVIVGAAFLGYIIYQDKKTMRELEKDFETVEN
jgi:hypothetical protein